MYRFHLPLKNAPAIIFVIVTVAIIFFLLHIISLINTALNVHHCMIYHFLSNKFLIRMTLVNIVDLTPDARNKVIELKVYRKWISRDPNEPTPRGHCCILMDKLGDAIQANTNFDDIQYFDSILKQHTKT